MKILPILLGLIAPLAAADVDLRFDDGSMAMVAGDRVLLGDDEAAALFRSGESSFLMINYDERTYFRVEEGFMSDAMAGMQAQMEQMLAELPEAQRQMARDSMAQMMPQAQPAAKAPEVRRTGRRDSVQGYSCSEVEIVYDDGTTDTACVASAADLGVAEADLETLAGAFTTLLASVRPGGDDDFYMDFSAMGGVPVRLQDVQDDGSPTLLLSVSTDVDASRMAVPEDFREVSMDQLMGQ